jgi:hypothetical protein
MPKTLEAAIGCWTSDKDYNSLIHQSHKIGIAAQSCRRYTLANKPVQLEIELKVLRNRLETMLELTIDAQRRITEIMQTGELEK